MRPTPSRARLARAALLLLAGFVAGCATAPAKIRYEEYVWPPPPDPPRIQLDDIVLGRADTLAKSGFQRALLGASPQGPYDWFKRPFAVAYDAQGRLLVTDSGLGALFRFDRAARLSSFAYFGVAVTYALEALVWHRVPGTHQWLGAALIAIAGMLVTGAWRTFAARLFGASSGAAGAPPGA